MIVIFIMRHKRLSVLSRDRPAARRLTQLRAQGRLVRRVFCAVFVRCYNTLTTIDGSDIKHTRTQVRTHKRTQAHRHPYTHARTYARTHARKHTHTHTHTHTQKHRNTFCPLLLWRYLIKRVALEYSTH